MRRHAEQFALPEQRIADPDQPVDLAGLQERCHFLVERFFIAPALQDIGQDHRPLRVLLLLTDEIQRDRQRAEIGIIAVVDDRTIVDAILQLQAHRHRAEVLHAFRNRFLAEADDQQHGPAVNGILDGRIVGKRNADAYEPVLPDTLDLRIVVLTGDTTDLQIGFDLPRPGETLAGRIAEWQLSYRSMDLREISTIDQGVNGWEEPELLFHFLDPVLEIFVVRGADIGDQSDRRLNDRRQSGHFAGPGNTRFKDSQGVFGLHSPDRQGYADL